MVSDRGISNAGRILALLLLAAGCGDDKPGGKKKPEPVVPPAPTCRVSAEAIASSPGCLADKDCPCGATCELGRCVAGCASDSACATGERCDSFGRCRALTATTIVPPPSRGAAATLELLDPLIVGAGELERPVRFVARGADAGTIRVVAPLEAEVLCDTTGAFAAECTLPALTEDTVATVWVRPVDPAGRQVGTPPVAGTLEVYTGDFRAEVGFSTDPLIPDPEEGLVTVPAPQGPPPPEELAGLYQGTVEVTGEGIAATATAPGSPVTGRAPLPITAKLFLTVGDAGVLAITDASHTLHPSGQWIGALTQIDLSALTATPAEDATDVANRVGTATLAFPAHLAFSGPLTATDLTEVVAETTVTALAVRDLSAGGFALELEVVVQFKGVLARSVHPQRALRLRLRRAGPLAQDDVAPEVPTAAAAPDSLALAGTPTAWEAALATTIAPWSQVVSPHSSNPFVYSWFTNRPASVLDPCFQPASNREQVLAGLPFSPIEPLTLPDVFLDYVLNRATQSRRYVSQAVLDALQDAVDQLEYDYYPAGPATRSDFALTGADVVRINTLGGGTTPTPDVIPCDLSATSKTLTLTVSGGGPATETITVPLAFPSCEDLKTRLGCTYVAGHNHPAPCNPPAPCQTLTRYYRFADEPTLTYSGTATFCTSWFWGSCSNEVSRTFTVSLSTGVSTFDGCRLPMAPVRCGDHVSCFVDETTAESTGGLSSTQGALSGELACNSGAHSGGLPLDEALDLPPGDPDRPEAGELFTACMTELAGFGATPPSAGTPEELLDGAPVCVDPARLLPALAALAAGARAKADNSTNENSTTQLHANGARAHRLLQRWLQTHAFLARESVEREGVAAIVRREETAVATPAEVLNAGLRAWDLLLHPRFSAVLHWIDDSVLAAPDYRAILYPASASEEFHDQPVGLSVAILDAGAAQLALAELVLDQALLTGDDAALTSTNALLARLDVARILADVAFARARAYTQGQSGSDPSWAAAYESAVAAVDTAHARVVAKAGLLDRGANPFGIEDEDLPLYFLGDTAGPGGRFAAISDFLIGTGPGSTAWAPATVAGAQAAIDAARAAWTAQQARAVAQTEAEQAHTERVAALGERYGAVLADLCGLPPGATPSQLLDWQALTGRPFSAETCYGELQLDACVIEEAAYLQTLSVEDVANQLHAASMQYADKQVVTGGTASTLAEVLTYFQFCSPSTVVYPVTCVETVGEHCIQCQTTNGPALELAIDLEVLGQIAAVRPDVLSSPSMPPAVVAALAQQAEMQKWVAQSAAAVKYPGARTALPTLEELNGGPLPATCFRGALGEQALTLRALATDVEIARARAAEYFEAYRIARESCDIQKLAAEQRQALETMHATIATQMRNVKLTMDTVASIAGGVKDCASGWSVNPFNFVANGANCAAGAVETGAESLSLSMQANIDRVTEQHQQLVAALATAADLQSCYKEAELELVGATSAALEISRANLELDKARVHFANLLREAQAAFDEGSAAVAIAEAQTMLPLSGDFWLGEAVATYARKMRLARRVTYLAVRAVEYEFQMSLDWRDAVFTAEVPDDLGAVLDLLWSQAATRTINGRRPTDLKVVVSLRQELLQLADLSDQADDEAGLAAGYKNLSDQEKLQLLLTDPRFQVHGADGTYLGQRIPFTIAPLAALELGEAIGVALLAENDCAERVWSVNASILGEPGLYVGSDTTFTRIELQKANTFFSQWCMAGAAGDEPFQVASVRPSRNLFHEPGLGESVSEVLTPEGRPYTSARIEAYFNVARGEFERDDYANGETSELAARGLYGQYWLFFPASTLTAYDADGLPTRNGLDLFKVTDILLRLDYVSVAKN